MSQDIIALDNKLPAHLQNLGGSDDDWTSGTTAGFPIISTKGKVFHIKRGDDLELVEDPNDPGEAARSLNLVVVKTNKGVTKTFYEATYEEGSQDKPDCYSLDGIYPARDAENRQCKSCAACPQNQWGSRKTESGKDAKRCSDVKRLAVAAVGLLNDPMLLRVPPTSLRTWDQYVDMLRKRNLTPAQVVTKVSFDPAVAHQALVFKAVDFVTEDMVPGIVESMNSTVVESMLGSISEGGGDAVDNSGRSAPEAEEPPKPKRKKEKKGKKKAKQKQGDKKAAKSSGGGDDLGADKKDGGGSEEGLGELDGFDFDDDDFSFDD